MKNVKPRKESIPSDSVGGSDRFRRMRTLVFRTHNKQKYFVDILKQEVKLFSQIPATNPSVSASLYSFPPSGLSPGNVPSNADEDIRFASVRRRASGKEGRHLLLLCELNGSSDAWDCAQRGTTERSFVAARPGWSLILM